MATDAVVKKIAKDFKVNVNSDSTIRSLLKKKMKGTANYVDADKYAIATAKALSKALADNLIDETLSTADYRAIVAEALPGGLKATQSTVNSYAEAAQRVLNKNAKINLKVVVPKIDSEAIATTTAKAVKAAAYSEISGAVTQDSMSFAQNVAVKMMKDNASFQHNVGYDITVIRQYDDVGLHRGTKYAEQCDWCLEREGTWSYDDALANGVFARHPGCGCTIIYNAEKGPQLQTDWTSNTWENL